jgi:hypothetical protein
MQHIAIICLAAATLGSSLLLGWLWCMASSGSVPAWLKRLHDSNRHEGSELL